jgi:hypothetical protein
MKVDRGFPVCLATSPRAQPVPHCDRCAPEEKECRSASFDCGAMSQSSRNPAIATPAFSCPRSQFADGSSRIDL